MNKEERRAFKIFLAVHDLTLSEFAKRCGVSKQYISSVVTGKAPITQSVRDTFIKGGYCIYE